MSRLMNYVKCGVEVLELGIAYMKAVAVLVGAVCKRVHSNGFYEVAFVKEGRRWYCDVPGFPKRLHEHTMMVGGAAKLLEYYSRGDERIVATIRVADDTEEKYFCGSRLHRISSTLTGGAFYKDPGSIIDEEIWLCPVTLFLLGKYPKHILLYKINKNYLHCPIYIE